MKQKIVALTLFIISFANAQSIDFLKQANKCDINFARQFSDEIIANTKTKYVFLDKVESNYLHLVTFIYIKDGLTKEEKESINANVSRYKNRNYRSEFNLTNCLTIHFRVTEVGANPDLEIKGTKEYAFSSVEGKFLDLFPFYQKHIEPTATTEKTTTTGVYSIRKETEGYWYNFVRSETDSLLWDLRNNSFMLK